MGDTFSWWWKTTASRPWQSGQMYRNHPRTRARTGLGSASCALLQRCGWKCPLRTSANNIHNEGKQKSMEQGWRWKRGWELKAEKQAEIHLVLGATSGSRCNGTRTVNPVLRAWTTDFSFLITVLSEASKKRWRLHLRFWCDWQCCLFQVSRWISALF